MINIDNAISIIQGEDRTIPVILLIDNEPFKPWDITGATEIVATFIKNDQTTITKTLTALQVSIVEAVCGMIEIELAAADTLNMRVSDKQSFEIAVTIAGKVRKTQIMGRLNIRSKLEC